MGARRDKVNPKIKPTRIRFRRVMKELYKIHLFDKHVLVNDYNPAPEHCFEACFMFASMLDVKIINGKNLATPELVMFTGSRLGLNVPKPFYVGFPQSVKGLTKEELLFDQLVSYYLTYGLDNFSEPRHSIMEKDFTRLAFKEKAVIKEFDIVDEKKATELLIEMVKNLLDSTRPLSNYQYQLVCSAISDYDIEVTKCPCKDTAIRLMLDLGKVELSKFLHLSDFIKTVELANYYLNSSIKTKKLNLKNKQRVLLSKILDALFEGEKINEKDCLEKRQAWCGYLHHIHYKPKNPRAQKFVDTVRGKKDSSVYSEFQKFIDQKDVISAVDVLVKRKGAVLVLRNLNYLLSQCQTEPQVNYVIKNVKTTNNLVLIQLLLRYANYRESGARTFTFTRFNRLVTHRETPEEIQKRTTAIPQSTVDKLVAVLKENLKNNLYGKLGKVYVHKDMKNIALPVQENTSMGGFGILPKGSVIPLPAGKKVRAFTYWEKVNDVDLSLIGVDDQFNQYEYSWRTMAYETSDAMCYSGDETSGYYGGSEYYDLDLVKLKKKKPNVRYYLLCNNVYTGKPFSSCVCRAGFMMRDKKDSGEVFEPRTVTSSYTVNCDSTFAYLFAVDVNKRRIIWLNMGKQSNTTIAGTTKVDFLIDYLNATEVINVHSLFTMLATKVVKDPKQADVIVTDEQIEVGDDVTVIRSYDTDKILSIINE